MEQSRAPAVLPYHPDLAWQAADQPSGRGRTDRGNHHHDRSEGALRTCPTMLSERDQGHRRRDVQPEHYGRQVPPGMELHHRPQSADLKQLLFGVALPSSWAGTTHCRPTSRRSHVTMPPRTKIRSCSGLAPNRTRYSIPRTSSRRSHPTRFLGTTRSRSSARIAQRVSTARRASCNARIGTSSRGRDDPRVSRPTTPGRPQSARHRRHTGRRDLLSPARLVVARPLSAGTNGTPFWYAQADKSGTYNRRNRNMGLDSARLCRHRYERRALTGSSTTICFHAAFCPQTVAFPAYAYQKGIPLVPANMPPRAASPRISAQSCSARQMPPIGRRIGGSPP